jgi:hypothetical protein
MIRENVNQRDQSQVNTRHGILIGSDPPESNNPYDCVDANWFFLVHDEDLLCLFIVWEPAYKV